jgi:hypothetical protein
MYKIKKTGYCLLQIKHFYKTISSKLLKLIKINYERIDISKVSKIHQILFWTLDQ